MKKTEQKNRGGLTASYISLFSGAMGLDLGLERQGLRPLVVNDVDPAAARTIRRNRPHLPVIDASVETITRRSLKKLLGLDPYRLPLIVGGAPCQSFSIMGRRRGTTERNGELIFEFARIVGALQPSVFLMENVRGLHNMPLVPGEKADGSLLREIIRQFEKIGYRLDCFLVNSANYGAPQIRERLICIGNRHALTAQFQAPQFSNRPADRLPAFRTLRDAIGNGFHDPDTTIMNFSARKLRYLAMVPPGGNWRSLPAAVQQEAMGKQYYLKGGRSSSWRRLSWDFPCPTIHTLPNHATTSMCHPSVLRALTVGECAAVQGFPADWIFEGTPAERYRQVGNAVPVKLGEIAGQAIATMLQSVTDLPRRCNTKPPSRVVHLRPHVRTRQYWKNGGALAGDFEYSPGSRRPNSVVQGHLWPGQ